LPKLISETLGFRRRAVNAIALTLIASAAIVVTTPLIAILGTIVYRGFSGLHWSFLTQIPAPPGEVGGGMANAIAGSGMILGLACLVGIPLGIGSGVYLAEYGRNRWGNIVRFTADVLNGVPSVVIGITVYALVVATQKHFSMLAGAIALGIIMIPTVCRTTEEVLLMVPQAIREAAFGLGIPQWRTTLSVVLPTASSGIVTSVMLAFARIAGETAPLLFTTLGNGFWNLKPNQPTAALPLQIYTYAISAYDDWHDQAWTGALVLIALIIAIVITVRFAANRGALKGAY